MSTTQSIYDETRRDLAANPATGRHAVWLRLMRKEAKQLIPLMVMLVGCGVLLHLLGLLQPRANQVGFHVSILALIPILFAVGVGPLLISQEKENRTLRWMASLPVPPRSIVVSKLIVSMLGLIAIWCISLAITFLFSSAALSTVHFSLIELQFYPANTFFLLTMGFALAWILPTAGSTLIALVASASVTGVFAFLAQEVRRSNNSDDFLRYLFFFQLVITAILVMAAIRFGKRSFITEPKSESFFSWGREREHSISTVDRTKTQPLSPASSLIWQVARQNRMLWVGVFFIGMMGLASVAYVTGLLRSPSILGFSSFVGCVVLSWLGASVFGSDANHARIRFLAERGVHPFKIWWTRLVLPLVCVVLGVLGFFLMNQAWSLSRHYNGASVPNLDVMFGGLLVLGVLMTFGLAQWLPQWTRSSLIAFCISPALPIFSFVYVGFLLSVMNAPWWLLIVSIGISFAATRLMICPWMDGRTGLRYWLSQSALLIGSLILPLIPFLITFATYPNMPNALRQELTEEAKTYEPFMEEIELVNPANDEDDTSGEIQDEFIGFDKSVSDSVVALERQLSSISGPIIYSRSMRASIREAQLMSLRMDAVNEDPADRQQEYSDRYHRSLILLSKFAIHMRMSNYLFDQEVSDQIERWLVLELLKPGRRELFSEEEYSTMVAALANQTGRQQSRRRAVVVSWYQFGEGMQDFGGLEMPAVPTKSMATSWLVADRNVGRATAALLEYLDSKNPKSEEFPEDIRSFWPTGVVEFDRQFKSIDANAIRTPGVLWHQDWETKAAQFNKALQ